LNVEGKGNSKYFGIKKCLLLFSVCWSDSITVKDDKDLLDWTTEEMRARVEKMVLTAYDDDEAEDGAATRFQTCAKIQALVGLTDPVSPQRSRKGETTGKKWNFAPEYYFYAADFNGNSVSETVDVEKELESKPRVFDKEVHDKGNVSVKLSTISLMTWLKLFQKIEKFFIPDRIGC
jgi:hypothetical protein